MKEERGKLSSIFGSSVATAVPNAFESSYPSSGTTENKIAYPPLQSMTPVTIILLLLFNPRLIANSFLIASSAAAVGGIALVGKRDDVDGFEKRSERSKDGVTDDVAIEVDVGIEGNAVEDEKLVNEVTLVLVIFELGVCNTDKEDEEVNVSVNVSKSELFILLDGVET